MPGTDPEISIIIPTYNERETISSVVRDVHAVAMEEGYAVEIIIVDDNSPDGTGQEAERLAKQLPITVIHRQGKQGLGSAVVEGFEAARGRIWGLMDADCSHPAGVLPDLIEPIRTGDCTLTIASRYAPGGSVEYWPWHRWLLSHAATWLARRFARGVCDPLSGFVFFERSVVGGVPLSVTGYKIGLEILIKGHYDRVVEIPYTFRNRETGHSKLGWSEYLNYTQSLVRHLLYLLKHRKERVDRRRVASAGRAGPHDQIALRGERVWGPCPVCSSDNAAELFVKDSYRYVRCRECDLVYVSPMPAGDELNCIYQDPRYFANRNEWSYGYNDYFEERAFYDALFRRRVLECEHALGVDSGHGLRMLDVGCAAGFLLEIARERGWNVRGVELSKPAAEFANKRLDNVVSNCPLPDAGFEDQSFDCVMMLDIIEHVSDPVALLREGARVLKPGGVLFLSAPNARSLSARLLGRRWFHYKRDHVVLLSGKTVLRALSLEDLDPVALGRNGKMVSLNYLFARVKTYVPILGRLLLATVGRMGICDRLFYDSWTGELLAVCRKRSTEAEMLPKDEEVYGRMRSRYFRPTALWRTTEYFRLRGVEAGRPILDLGSGDGFFARQVFSAKARASLVGVDLRQNELLDLQRFGDGASGVVADATSLPFRSGAFGFVLANCSLEHVDGIERAVAEIGRILRPGGRLAFTVPAENFNETLFFPALFNRLRLRPLARAYGAIMGRGLQHRNILAPDRWRTLLESASLDIERMVYFMPRKLAHMWDRRWWVALPGFALARFLRPFRSSRHLHPRRLPGWPAEEVRRQIIQSAETGAGAVYFCIKRVDATLASSEDSN